MNNALSLISKIHEAGNRYIIERLRENCMNDLVPSHGDILFVLFTCGKSTMKDIADKVHRTKPTVTVLVNKLENLGLVEREKSDKDSRVTYIKLTENGEFFRPIFEEISNGLNSMLYSGFSEKQTVDLTKLLEKMLKNI